MTPAADLRPLRVFAGPFEPQPQAAKASRPAITPRQLEVLRLVADGHENKTIASMLGLADRTIEHHVADICAAFGARNRTGAAVAAVRMGVV